jgi:hypothetical protein
LQQISSCARSTGARARPTCFKAAISSYPRLITNGFAYRQNVGRRVYALLLDNRSLVEQVFAAASGYNAGAGAAASWTLIKVLNMCMIVLGRSHGVISSRSPAGRHEPGVGASTTAAPGASTTSTRYQQNCTCWSEPCCYFSCQKQASSI